MTIGNYSRSTMIATAIRNGRSCSTWKNRSTFNDEGRYPTTESDDNRSICVIMHRQHTANTSRLTYWLSVALLSHSRWPTVSTIKQLSTTSKDHISYIAKMWKEKSRVDRTYPRQRRFGRYCRGSTMPRAPELNDQY